MRRTERAVLSPEPLAPTSEPETEDLCSEFVDSKMVNARLQSPPRLLLVNHWATWCEGCVEELPLLVELHKKWSEHVDFVGVSWESFQGDSGLSVLREVHGFSKALQLEWDSWVITDSPEIFFEAMGMECQTIPQIWLVTTDGTIVTRFEEVLDSDGQKALDGRIEALIHGN